MLLTAGMCAEWHGHCEREKRPKLLLAHIFVVAWCRVHQNRRFLVGDSAHIPIVTHVPLAMCVADRDQEPAPGGGARQHCGGRGNADRGISRQLAAPPYVGCASMIIPLPRRVGGSSKTTVRFSALGCWCGRLWSTRTFSANFRAVPSLSHGVCISPAAASCVCSSGIGRARRAPSVGGPIVSERAVMLCFGRECNED